MAAFAATTERIAVGSGVVNTWTRNVGLLAATFVTLDDLAPGRVLLGLGAWWDPLARRVGVKRRRPLQCMRETVEACRALFTLEKVDFSGEFVSLDGVRIDVVHGDRSPRRIPIYIGATGPKMLELSGEIADGVIFNYMVSPLYNDSAMERVAEGARRAGRRVDELDRPQLIVCSLDEDRTKALDAARMLLTQYLGQQPHIMKASGVDSALIEEIKAVVDWPASAADIERAAELVPDEVVQMVSASGTREECLAKVAEYMEHGATCPVLYPLGDDVEAMIDTFAPSPVGAPA
jgi:5,10-methylenetetrahydromethanopterin reductase